MPNMDPIYFILDKDGVPFECSFTLWNNYIQNTNRVLRNDKVDKYSIVTSFLGVSNKQDSKKMLWRSAVSRGDKIMDYLQEYASKSDALEGHERLIDNLKYKVIRFMDEENEIANNAMEDKKDEADTKDTD